MSRFTHTVSMAFQRLENLTAMYVTERDIGLWIVVVTALTFLVLTLGY